MNGDETDADAEAVQAAVRSVSSVVDLVGGMAGVATFLPGRRVDGVRVTPGEVEIHIAAGYDVPLPAVAQQVRERVLPLVGQRAVSVYIDDVRQPAGASDAPAGAGPA